MIYKPRSEKLADINKPSVPKQMETRVTNLVTNIGDRLAGLNDRYAIEQSIEVLLNGIVVKEGIRGNITRGRITDDGELSSKVNIDLLNDFLEKMFSTELHPYLKIGFRDENLKLLKNTLLYSVIQYALGVKDLKEIAKSLRMGYRDFLIIMNIVIRDIAKYYMVSDTLDLMLEQLEKMVYPKDPGNLIDGSDTPNDSEGINQIIEEAFNFQRES